LRFREGSIALQYGDCSPGSAALDPSGREGSLNTP
jgi:hypothetical protein